MTTEEKIRDLISQMTLEEKVSQLVYESPAIEKLGIPAYNWWNEGLHGVARAGEATVFPQAIGLAASFDRNLVKDVFTTVSDEARAKYNAASRRGNRGQFWGLTYWTPNINIFRDPRWGRGQETYGEDPYLTGEIGVQCVKGLQGDDPENLKLAACAKHFAVHSGPEKDRHTFNAECSQKDLWETYLSAFEKLVGAGVETVMGAYNRTLGEPCCGSKYLLKDILREKWQFKGHVVSDCWAIKDFHTNHKVTDTPAESAALALNNGCDVNCGCTYPSLVAAVKAGLTTEEKVDQALTRLLRTRFKLGMFDFDREPSERDPAGNSPYTSIKDDVIRCDRHKALAKKAAEESIVLLRNKNSLLPLDRSAKKILCMGPSAANINALISNYYGTSPELVTILEGVTKKVCNQYEMTLDYHQCCTMYDYNKNMGWTVGMAENADVVIACFGLDNAMEGEEGDAIASDSKGDRDSIELPVWQLEYLKAVKERGTPVILVLTGGSAVAIPEDLADAILYVWYPGEQGGHAVADVIFGDAVPGGKLPVTFPKSTDQLPPYENYDMKGRTYRYMTEEPLYPFGFGLSYADFAFDGLVLKNAAGREITEATETELEEGITAEVTVTNRSAFAADQVVQIYVTPEKRLDTDPVASLKGFERVSVPAGKTVSVSVRLDRSSFAMFKEDGSAEVRHAKYTVIAADAAPVKRSLDLGACVPVKAGLSIN